jgi:CBS-domain-containing membrane protein
MHAIPARQLITQSTFTMRQNTPLLKAAALMLTHDLNQLAVTDSEGAIVGSVSPSTVARHLPRFIL